LLCLILLCLILPCLILLYLILLCLILLYLILLYLKLPCLCMKGDECLNSIPLKRIPAGCAANRSK